MNPRGWLLLLAAWLFLWEPMRLAGELAASVGTIGMRGTGGVVELAAHAVVAALAATAAWGVWIRHPRAPAVASLALAASAAVAVQSVYWSYLPGDVAPGQQLPRAAAAIAHAAGWMTYLLRSRRVRAAFD